MAELASRIRYFLKADAARGIFTYRDTSGATRSIDLLAWRRPRARPRRRTRRSPSCMPTSGRPPVPRAASQHRRPQRG